MSSLMAPTQEKILNGKDFLTMKESTPTAIADLLKLAQTIKAKLQAGEEYTPLKGKTLGMIFEKSSTRTRVSFEVGMMQLGGHALFLSGNDLQIGRGESISDTAKVLSEYIDGIMIRTFEHEKIMELSENASIPVINGLTDLAHPCQVMADFLTIIELKGQLKGLKMSYIGDGNNVAQSLMVGCAKMGMDFSIGCPDNYKPDVDVVAYSQKVAKENGCEIVVTNSAVEAIKDADIVYSDVWTSMGQEIENSIRLEAFKDYQINSELVKHAKDNYIFMHCLPAHREEEVTAEVIDGPNSVVFHQAGNRLHAQKAVLVDLMS
ncbi:ornithine carbamoyltransferase [Peribacillus butanolivorans]|uniref:Ornithine carbamoyltransferase n=1 Tax=Peribacillus butanolivorans TaxID=421767 RepID=A0ABM6XNV4_9BACI|nr:ornithine carbamoyltransferase [Peribacillus butanolivorans]AXN40179.1 ornithine carbamoyltransferase [Peribacillus butanolivorans]